MILSSAFGSNHIERTVSLISEQGYKYEVCENKSIYAQKGDYLILCDSIPQTGMLVVNDKNRCEKYNGQNYKGVVFGIVKNI